MASPNTEMELKRTVCSLQQQIEELQDTVRLLANSASSMQPASLEAEAPQTARERPGTRPGSHVPAWQACEEEEPERMLARSHSEEELLALYRERRAAQQHRNTCSSRSPRESPITATPGSATATPGSAVATRQEGLAANGTETLAMGNAPPIDRGPLGGGYQPGIPPLPGQSPACGSRPRTPRSVRVRIAAAHHTTERSLSPPVRYAEPVGHAGMAAVEANAPEMFAEPGRQVVNQTSPRPRRASPSLAGATRAASSRRMSAPSMSYTPAAAANGNGIQSLLAFAAEVRARQPVDYSEDAASNNEPQGEPPSLGAVAQAKVGCGGLQPDQCYHADQSYPRPSATAPMDVRATSTSTPRTASVPRCATLQQPPPGTVWRPMPGGGSHMAPTGGQPVARQPVVRMQVPARVAATATPVPAPTAVALPRSVANQGVANPLATRITARSSSAGALTAGRLHNAYPRACGSPSPRGPCGGYRQ
mmetsp:Transcript_28059/g.71004  ORF Transcript_28059/g.71004 Transcript_28059/m.71004 type:complete len:479 (-) Transcript_28059:73-1509(-)